MARKGRHRRQRYVDSETGIVFRKKKANIDIALVYPNRYSVGMSNLGFQTVYRLLNEMDSVRCERAFLPDPEDAPDALIRTVESQRSIAAFSIIAFSVPFESDFLNLIAVVEKTGLPLQSAARGDPHPLVIAGGVACFLNPEPIAPFIDCFLIGEAEQLLPPFIQAITQKEDWRKHLPEVENSVPGIYVPKLYQPAYHADGTLKRFDALAVKAPSRIKRVYEKKISAAATVSTILTPHTVFPEIYLIEVSRGCPHGCRFCSAGYIYRPPRFRDAELLKRCIDKACEYGKRIGLMGAAVSDHPDIGDLCRYALDRDLSVSFSSFRANAISRELIEALQKSNIKTVTIAPEAGSEKMRRIINKGITEKQVLEAVDKLVHSRIINLKLYFMVGLPYEEDADVESIVTLCRRIREVFLAASRENRKIGTITVSVNPFVPKPFTPFQWAPMDTVAELNRKIKMIRDGLRRVANLRVQAESPRKALVQAVLSRGDRRVADLLVCALKNKGNWSRTFKETRWDTAFYANRQRPVDELLPWDFIDHGIRKAFLEKEWKRAGQVKTSVDCPVKGCVRCGVCEDKDQP